MTTSEETGRTKSRKKTPGKAQTPTQAVAEETGKHRDATAIEPGNVLDWILRKPSPEDALKTDITELGKAIDFAKLGNLDSETFDATVELFVRRIEGIDRSVNEEEEAITAIHIRIKKKECSATVEYWHLGKLLLHKRETFRGGPKGAWGEWLEARGIERTKSQRARDIAAGYDSPDDVANMTVNQAVDNLKRPSERETEPWDALGPRGQIEKKLSSWGKWLDSHEMNKLLQKVEHKDRIVDALDKHIAQVTKYKDNLLDDLGGKSDLARIPAETINVAVPTGK